MSNPPHPRHLLFLALFVLAAVLFWLPLRSLVALSSADDRYSHTALIPLISAGIVYLEKRRIFQAPRYAPRLGGALLLAGIVLYAAARIAAPDHLTLQILALVLVWIGAFLLCYGPSSLKAASFPALFLLLAIPLPAAAVERVSLALQAASAEIAHGLFRLLGIPVFRQGYTFSLPGLTIEVAEQCSGIRSTTALVITGVLVGYVFLRSGWNRLALVLATAFVGIAKNAGRIVFLSGMTSSTGLDYLNGQLHHRYGGTVFSLAAFALLAPVFLLLLRRERPPKTVPQPTTIGHQ